MKNAQLLLVAAASLIGACAPADELSFEEQTELADSNTSHDWTYEGEHGPKHWSELAAENEACGHATTQSPVDLKAHTPVADLPDLVHRYSDSAVAVHNTGHTVQYDYDKGSEIKLGERTYELVQLHFHAHSEHALDGDFAPMELHLVHRDKAGSFLVVGVFIREGAHNRALDDAGWGQLPRTHGQRLHDAQRRLRADALIPHGPSFRYAGSLTTPPCTEAVSWAIYERPITMSRAQLEGFSQLYNHDYRPLQPLGERPLLHGE